MIMTEKRVGKTNLVAKDSDETSNGHKEQVEVERDQFHDLIKFALTSKVQEDRSCPDGFKQLERSSDWLEWKKAMFEELDSIIDQGVF